MTITILKVLLIGHMFQPIPLTYQLKNANDCIIAAELAEKKGMISDDWKCYPITLMRG